MSLFGYNDRVFNHHTYGLSGTSTTRTLEGQLAAMHNAERGIIVPSRQAAISVALLALLKQGDHVLVTDNVYPPVKQFAHEVLSGPGIDVEYFDPLGSLVGCDNTWATGLLCKPLDLGVDLVAEALTKYAGGHSDILLGALIVRDLDL